MSVLFVGERYPWEIDQGWSGTAGGSSSGSKPKGGVLVKTSGSHHKFKHPDRKHHIVVAHPVKDMPTGTARAIARAAGWLE